MQQKITPSVDAGCMSPSGGARRYVAMPSIRQRCLPEVSSPPPPSLGGDYTFVTKDAEAKYKVKDS